MRSEQGKLNAAKSKSIYDKNTTKSLSLKLNLKTDADILEHLSTIDNFQGYIKGLIREDIARCNAAKGE